MKYSRSRTSRLNPLFYFILLSLCSSCDGLRFRRLPEERDLIFEVAATDPQKCCYKPNQAIEITLKITSEEENAQEKEFHILSATLSDGTDVLSRLRHDPLKLHDNIVRYTPQGAGVYDIQFRIGVPYEEEGVQESTCRVEATKAVWDLRAEIKNTGELNVIIDGPEEWEGESWHIVEGPQWSEGLIGTISRKDYCVWEDTPLRRGDNKSQITLRRPNLNAPHLCFTLEGPDKEVKSCRVDLTPLCVEQLKGDMSEQEQILATCLGTVNAYVQQVDEHFTQDAQGSYQLPPDTTTDPRVKSTKREELATLLGEIESYQRVYKQNFQVFEAHLESLAQGQTNTNVHIFRRDHKRLQGAIASLKSAQVQLGCRCTSAHEALFKQLREGEQEETEILLEDPKLDPNAKCRINNREETLLHAAARMDNEMAVKKLMEKGANVNVKRSTDEATPLYLAITRGHENVAIILLEAEDIDPNVRCCIKDEEQETSLHAAARMGNEVTVRKLLEKGANVNAKRSTDSATPLYLAIDRDHESIVIVLLAVEGIDVNAKCRINEDDEEQETLLHAAARMGNEVAVKKLMEKGADVNARSTDYLTLMPKYALAEEQEAIQDDILEDELSDDLPDDLPNNEDAVEDYIMRKKIEKFEEELGERVEVEEGDTPLHLAVDKGHEGVVRILLEAKNIDVNARSRDGATPLHVAAAKNNPEVVRLLLNEGAEVNNKYGKWFSLSRLPNYKHLRSLLNEIHIQKYDISPLQIATANGNLEIITLLIDSGADINSTSAYGHIALPLHLAAAQGSVAAVKLLLERGAWINRPESYWTPLHVAAWMNQIDVAEVLLDRGAQVNPRVRTKDNPRNKTPYELGKTTEMRDLLQASGGRKLTIIDFLFS